MKERLSCDVLVVGAGVCGMRAAESASAAGASVILAVKGKIGSSGASAYTVTEASGFGVADGYRCPEDSPDRHFEDIMRAGHGMCDPAVVRTLVDGALDTVQELEGFGVSFEREADGRYLVSQGCFGSLPWNYNLRGHGTGIIRALRQHLKESVRIMEDVMITDLLLRGGRCVGAAALDRTGRELLISAKAVVLASGGAGRLFRFSLNPAEMTGDSYALGYLAGAKLQNLEFMQVGMGVLPPGKSILNSWIWSVHPKVTDRFGNPVFPEVFPDGITLTEAMDLKSTHYPFSMESPSRNIEIWMQRAIAEGRGCDHGGVMMDAVSALKNRQAGKLQLFEDMWRLTNAWFLSRGIRPEESPMEIACFAHAINGGLKIDPRAKTSVPGLYAAGEASAGPHGADRLGGNMLVTCTVFGKIAGQEAAAETDAGFSPNPEMPEPLGWGGSGKPAGDLIENLRSAMLNNLLVVRSEEKCRRLEEVLNQIAEEAPSADFSGMSVWAPYEMRNMLLTSQLMLEAVRWRRESRGSHYREDYPRENPEFEKPYTIQRT